jgi:ATP-dependent Clp protease ATP-binding subunit ClpB
LQVLDDGRLTDGHGRTVDFRHTIILMTSNIGSEFLQDGINKEKQEQVLKLVKQHFRPEFLNRIDDLILFSGLTENDLLHIIDIMVHRLDSRLKRQEITLSIDDDAKKALAHRGYDKAYGARPLERLIQREIVDKLAIGLMEKRFGPGSHVRIGFKDNNFTLSKV